MRNRLIHGLALLALCACTACALEPTPRPDPDTFANEVEAFAKRPPRKGGIVFAGSSSIRMWSQLKQDFPGLPVINHGFGGSVSNDLIVHFDTVVARHEPKLLVTYSGNDLHKKLTVSEAFADYTGFLNLAHQRFPELRVIVTSVKVARSRAAEIPRVHELNARLEVWSAERDWVRYLDCTSYLSDADGDPIPEYFRADELHLSPAGYSKWHELLEPVVREEWAKIHSDGQTSVTTQES
jgi:lysophospholipase L1-like esterase